MRRIAFILAAGFVCAACATTMNGPPPPPPPPPPTTINVLRRPGGTYPSTASLTVGVVELIPCTTVSTGAAPPPTEIRNPALAHTVRSGSGDEMEVPANATAMGAQVTLRRQPGAYRAVEAYASAGVRNARITIDFADCAVPATAPVRVVRKVRDDLWEDVGGTRSGNQITTPALPHLSIYALAGGN